MDSISQWGAGRSARGPADTLLISRIASRNEMRRPGDQAFQRFAAVTALVGVAFAIVSALLGLAAAPGSPGPTALFSSVVPGSPTPAPLFRLSMLADVFGYCLPLIPLAIFLWWWLHPGFPLLSALLTAAGVGASLLGAAGAASLGQVLPALFLIDPPREQQNRCSGASVPENIPMRC